MGNTPLTGPKNIGQFAEHNLELPSGELKLGEDFERKLELSVGAPEEIRTPDPQIRSYANPAPRGFTNNHLFCISN
jgi:hypothetical protein